MSKERQILVFSAGTGYYGLEVQDVQEVSRMPEITAVPQTAPHVIGMCSNRGDLISVVDLTCHLSCGRIPAVTKDHLMVVTHDSHIIGIGIDAVYNIAKVKDEEIQAYPHAQPDHPNLVKGVLRFGDRLVSWLDTTVFINELLTHEDDDVMGIGSLDKTVVSTC